jgi:hypothetical protein
MQKNGARGTRFLWVDDYRQLASVCLALAKRTVDPQDRPLLLNVASKWLELGRGASTLRAGGRSANPKPRRLS